MNIASIGIDLGKTKFHLVALDDHGKTVIKKKFSRRQLFAYTADLKAALIGIEACSGAHFFDEAIYTTAQPMVPPTGSRRFSSAGEMPVPNARSDQRPREMPPPLSVLEF